MVDKTCSPVPAAGIGFPLWIGHVIAVLLLASLAIWAGLFCALASVPTLSV